MYIPHHVTGIMNMTAIENVTKYNFKRNLSGSFIWKTESNQYAHDEDCDHSKA
jgi:hypothetical protein